MSNEEFIIKFYSCDNKEQFLKDLYHDLNYLRQKNEQLKIQISAREEEYLKLENNWNELKNIIEKQIFVDSKTTSGQFYSFLTIYNYMLKIEG